MYYYRFYVLLLIVGLSTVGCDEPSENSSDTYIGGQIINPTSDHVILLRNNILQDTIFLDDSNRFGYRIKNAEEGLYVFKHVPQSRIIYLCAGDSLLVRANTLKFDESIHFSGTGSEKNNFLTDIFLVNENNTDLLLSYYKTEPKDFQRIVDSIKQKQLSLLNNATKKYAFSAGYMNVAEKSLDYEYNDLKERYTYLINKYYKTYSKKFPSDFHDYRKKVSFNDIALQTSPDYIRFIGNYLINEAMTECAGANVDSNDCYDLYDHRNITTRINIIDTLTNTILIKEHFFSKLGALGIVMAKEKSEIASILQLLKEKNYPEHKLQKLTDVGNLQLSYLPGMNVNGTVLKDYSGNERNFSELSSQPTIVFLWSIYSPENHRKNHRTINSLRGKYPEITFLGINVDTHAPAEWIKAVNQNNYDKTSEYQLKTSHIGKDAFQNYLNKTLFINKSGNIIIGDAFLNAPNFENRILEFLNQ